MITLILITCIPLGIFMLIQFIKSKELTDKGFLITHLNSKIYKMISFGYSVRQINSNLYEVNWR